MMTLFSVKLSNILNKYGEVILRVNVNKAIYASVDITLKLSVLQLSAVCAQATVMFRRRIIR
jgi:hypothetical protein